MRKNVLRAMMLVDGAFTFQATLQSELHTIKRCMTQMGYHFDY